MNLIPNRPEDCAICQRVEQVLMTSPVLRARLPETELAGLVQAVQAAILKKEVKKTERGINMADEKYVISKASFEDFYETQDTLVSIMEKMVDRIEKQDQVIMKFGAALTEVMSKDFGMPQELAQPVPEDEDVVEEEVPVEDNAEEELEEAEHDIVSAEEEEEEAKEEIQEEEAGVTPVPGVEHAPMMMDEKMAAEKSAFEAGYKAALAEMQKKTGVTVTPLEKPSTMTSRPVVPETSTGGVAKTLDSISDKELADMTPNQLNTWLRENRLYR